MCAISELLNYPKNRALEFITQEYIIEIMWLHSCPSASHQGYVAFSTSALLPWLILKYIRVGDICFIGCIVFTNKILQLKFNAGWPDLLKRLWDSFTNGEIKCWYNILTSASLNVTSSRSTNSPGTKSGWLGGIHNNALFFFFFLLPDSPICLIC